MIKIANCTCIKCQKTFDEKNFYTHKDGRKTDMCKKCLTMHIDNFNPKTYLWLLEDMDVPYVPEKWNALRDKAYAKDPYGMNGLSVFGRYLSSMKLKPWNEYTWADTERLMAQTEEKRKAAEAQIAAAEAETKEMYERGEITEAQYKTLTSTPTQNAELAYRAPKAETAENGFYNEANFMSEDELVDPAAELTKEDKLYLAMKWGRLYKPSEWLKLETKYNEMKNSFDIQDSDTEGTLLIICKTYLKMDNAIDIGDLDGFQKLSRVYDTLRKSAKFTAVQNKKENNNFVDSVSELVAYCEKHGGAIPRMEIDAPRDIIDKIIIDQKEYTKSLIYSDTTLAAQIEDYLKNRKLLDEAKKEKMENGGKETEVSNQDYVDYFEQIQELVIKDRKVYEEE